MLSALGKLFRTTAFKLSFAYLVLFAIGAGFVLGTVAWNVKGLMDEQIGQTIEAEIGGLAEQYAQGGMRRLVDIVERRSRVPGSSLYLVTPRFRRAFSIIPVSSKPATSAPAMPSRSTAHWRGSSCCPVDSASSSATISPTARPCATS